VVRPLAWSILVISTILASSPALAQMYDPRYPVCMQVYTIDGSSVGCGDTTMAKCKATASGRAAQCFVNPYFAGANRKRPVRAHRRHESLPTAAKSLSRNSFYDSMREVAPRRPRFDQF
jgi:hypothetical protein